jgi:SpoVK/Ycf46/Vps4 family AAA+-type ATPase
LSSRIFSCTVREIESEKAVTVFQKICSVMVVPDKVSLLQAVILIIETIAIGIFCLKISELLPERIKFSVEGHKIVLFLVRSLQMFSCAVFISILLSKLLVKLSFSPEYSRLVYLIPLCFIYNTWKKSQDDINKLKGETQEAKLKQLDIPDTKLDDVAGMEDVKEQIRLRMLLPLQQPEIAKRHGIAPGGGMLLYGPPGTGKTFIARAIAGELKIPFYAVTVADIFSKYIGESENNIRAIFEEIRKNKLSVLFIDELESIFRKRTDEIHESTRKVISILLQELDGIQTHDSQLLLIGATNTPQLVDEAFLRTGRLDVQIFVGLPDKNARKQILEFCFKNVKYPIPEGLIDFVAEYTESYSGADLKGLASKVKQVAFARKLNVYSEELFKECLAQTHPSPNAHILQQIKEWEQKKFQ